MRVNGSGADVPATGMFYIASHGTGHILSGFAPAIRHLAMGMVSQKEKRARDIGIVVSLDPVVIDTTAMD